MISKYKTAKHIQITITDTSLDVQRKQAQIEEEAALEDLRHPHPRPGQRTRRPRRGGRLRRAA